MQHSRVARWLLIAIAPLALAAAFGAIGTPAARAQGTPPVDHTTTDPYDGFGPGGTRETVTDKDGNETEVREYDAKHNLRFGASTTYYPGTKKRKREVRGYYTPQGATEMTVDERWDADGYQTDYENLHYGPDGIPDGGMREGTDDPQSDKNPPRQKWDPKTRAWVSVAPGKTASPATPETLAAIAQPVTEQVGVLIARDYHAGDTITGSLWPAKYAEAFNGVPGLNEYSFPIQIYKLRDGTPNWDTVEIGSKGAGYMPVGMDGSFSFQIPDDMKGSLQIQARQRDPVTGAGPGMADFQLDPPMAAPTLPPGDLPPGLMGWETKAKVEHLIDLWNEAFNLELEYTNADYDGASDSELGAIDEDLGEVYDDIDHLTARLPHDLVVNLAHELADESRTISNNIHKSASGDLTEDQWAKARDYTNWAEFLDDEADELSPFKNVFLDRTDVPYWTSPVLTQGRLAALRGNFYDDCGDTNLTLGGLAVRPIAATPDVIYYMPPDGLTAGANNLVIDAPGMPETTLPVFYMTLTMWADATQLQKGGTTTYHVKLAGVNGLPSSAWSSWFDPTDLVSSSDLQGASPQTSRTGTITLTVTNESVGTISMQNVFVTLNALQFAPAGSFQLDGGVGAILDGGFSIVGVARSFLAPIWGWGSYGSGAPNNMPPLGQATTGPPPDWYGDAAPVSTSTVSTPGLPPCDLSEGCLDSETLHLYNEATGAPNSATVGNPPNRPTHEEKRKRIDDAEAAAKAWRKRWDDAGAKASRIYSDAIRTVNQGILDDEIAAWQEAVRADLAADAAKEKYEKDRTSENKEAYEFDKALSERADADLDAAREKIINEFTPEQRGAYRDARADMKTAEHYGAEADQEVRDAMNAMDAEE